MIPFEYAFGTDIGRKRQQNQDNGLANSELGFFMVADGLGGHQGGETASALAVEVIEENVRQGLSQADAKTSPEYYVLRAIQSANQVIFERSQEEVTLRGMGTTTTALLFSA